jgi:hypothetical protein
MHFAVCDFLLDLVQNSVEAGAGTITVRVGEDGAWLSAAVIDDGKGMDEAELERALDPFYTDGKKHSRRKVGLGIPFLVQAVEQAGGAYELRSRKGSGTEFSFRFPAGGIDTPPLGDLPGFFLMALCFDGDYELVIQRSGPGPGDSYELRRSELRDAVGDFTDAGALVLAESFLRSQEEPDAL